MHTTKEQIKILTIEPGRKLNNFKNVDNNPLNGLKWEETKKKQMTSYNGMKVTCLIVMPLTAQIHKEIHI